MRVDAARRTPFRRRALARQQPHVVRVLAQFLDGAPPVRSRLQHASEEPHESRRKHLPLRRRPQSLATLPRGELPVKRVRLLVRQLPREVARQRAENQHGEAPHVSGCIYSVLLPLEGGAHLGRGVRDARAHLPYHCSCLLRHAEVHQFDSLTSGVEHEDVLRFDVPVHQPLAVHELERRRDLRQRRLRRRLREARPRGDGLEQVAEWGLLLREHVRRRSFEGYVVRVDDGAVRREVVAEVELTKEVLQFRRRLRQHLRTGNAKVNITLRNAKHRAKHRAKKANRLIYTAFLRNSLLGARYILQGRPAHTKKHFNFSWKPPAKLQLLCESCSFL